MSLPPLYAWNCVKRSLLSLLDDLKDKKLSDFNIKAMQVPSQCPVPCHAHKSCWDCLSSIGGEGGWRECYWSSKLHMVRSFSVEIIDLLLQYHQQMDIKILGGAYSAPKIPSCYLARELFAFCQQHLEFIGKCPWKSLNLVNLKVKGGNPVFRLQTYMSAFMRPVWVLYRDYVNIHFEWFHV